MCTMLSITIAPSKWVFYSTLTHRAGGHFFRTVLRPLCDLPETFRPYGFCPPRISAAFRLNFGGIVFSIPVFEFFSGSKWIQCRAGKKGNFGTEQFRKNMGADRLIHLLTSLFSTQWKLWGKKSYDFEFLYLITFRKIHKICHFEKIKYVKLTPGIV